MAATLKKLRERTDLPASVARLEARHDTVVAILQAPPRRQKIGKRIETSIEQGGVYLLDPTDLRSRLLTELPRLIRRATPSVDRDRVAILFGGMKPPFRPTELLVVGLDGRQVAARSFDERVSDCAWVGENLVLSVFGSRRRVDEVGKTAEVWSMDLATKLHELHVADFGADADAAKGIVAVSGIDLHLWRPGSDAPPFSLHHSKHAPPGEMGNAVLSPDGRRVAVVHDLRRGDEPQAVVLATEASSKAIEISDGTIRHVAELAFNPSGDLIALRVLDANATASQLVRGPDGKLVRKPFTDGPEIRVHRTSDGALAAKGENLGPRAMAWLDDTTLLLGGDTLSTWSW